MYKFTQVVHKFTQVFLSPMAHFMKTPFFGFATTHGQFNQKSQLLLLVKGNEDAVNECDVNANENIRNGSSLALSKKA